MAKSVLLINFFSVYFFDAECIFKKLANIDKTHIGGNMRLSTMTETEKDALGNRILSTLMELFAAHHGVKIDYEIVTEKEEKEHVLHRRPGS